MKKKTFSPYQSIKWRGSVNSEWQEGVYLHPIVGTRSHAIARSEHSDQTHTIPLRHILPYEKLKDDDAILNFGKANVEELVKFLKRGIDGIFKDGLAKLTVDGPNVSLMNGYITIDPAATDVEHALHENFIETTCWAVTIWRYIPPTREEPPDQADEYVGSALTNGQAASLALDTLYKVLADDFWQAMGEEQMYAELDDLEDKINEFDGR